MWKDFIYFSRTQRIAICALIICFVTAIAAHYFLPRIIHAGHVTNNEFMDETIRFRKNLINKDSLRKARWAQRQLEWQERILHEYDYRTRKPSIKAHYTLFTFDPNTLDSSGFILLGLKPFMAKNIGKYRKAGGHYKNADDFAKLYGLSTEKFNELKPYISIATPPEPEKRTTNKRTDLIVELNSADTTLLMQIKGIGRGYAFAIIRFRQQAGGFASVNQLTDVYGMTAENVEKIKPFCRVDERLIQTIRLNTATVGKMKNHPYIGFYKAKNIYEYRRKKGKINSIEELRDIPDITEKDIEQLRPYLNFE